MRMLLRATLLLALSAGVLPSMMAAPFAVPVRIWGTASAKYPRAGGDPASLGFYGTFLPATPSGSEIYRGSQMYSGPSAGAFGISAQTIRMEPGKRYTLVISGEHITYFALRMAAASGYRMEIDGIVRNKFDVSDIPLGFYDNEISVRVLGPEEEYAAPPGVASSLAGDRPLLSIGLGTLANGSSAGAIRIIDAGLSASWTTLFTPGALSYQPPSPEVTVHRSGGAVRQIIAPQTAVDVVSSAQDPGLSANQYELRFYHPSQVLGSPAPTGEPFVTYRVEQGATPTTLKVTSKTRNITSVSSTGNPVVRTAVTSLERTGTWPTFSWIRQDWNTEGAAQLAQQVTTGGGTESARTESIVVKAPGGATTLAGTRNFALFGWGEQVTSETVGSSNSITTAYDYYTDPAAPGSYGFLKSTVETGGNWTAFEYWDAAQSPGARTGRIKYRYRPYNSAPTSITFDPAQGEVTYFEYVADPFGVDSRTSLVETKINNTQVARATIAYEDESAAVNGMAVVVATRTDQTSNTPTDVLTTVTRYYREDTADAFFRNLTHSITRPDGVKISYAYQRGTWNGSTFTKAGAAGLDPGTASRVAIITGSMNATAGALRQDFDGYDIDNLYVIAGKSTLDVAIRDSRALIVRTEKHVWDGSDWKLVGSSDMTHDFGGRLTQRVDLNGSTYTAAYSGEQKQSETDATGVKVTYGYDAAGRLQTATKEAGGPLTYATTTTYTYNAAGQVLSETLSSTGTSETIVNSRTYDSAGRPASITPAGLSATTISYDPSARTSTTTAPDGGTTVSTLQLDGRLASQTGSAVVAQHYSYAVESNGRQLTQLNIGGSSSPRWTKSWADWIGRPVKSEKPGFSQSSQVNFIEENFYDDATIGKGRLYKTTRTGFAPTRYEYDALGRVVRTGLDVDNNGLVPASNDRITGSDVYFELHESAWWLRSQSTIYPTGAPEEGVLAGFTRTRVTGFTGNLRAETRSTDAEGNLTKTTVSVDRSAKTVTTTTRIDGITNDGIAVAVNGLEDYATGFDGLTNEAEYDALGRPWKSIDTRNKVVTTAYFTSTPLVQSVRDQAQNYVKRFGYDSMGRVAWAQDAADAVTRFAYNQRSQLTQQWGGGAYPVEFGYDATYGERTTMKTYRGGSNWDAASWAGVTTDTADTTTWVFDGPSGLLWKKIDAANKAVAFNYNARGQIATRTWARGVVTTYTYDPDTGELTGQTYSDGTPNVGFTYTRLGQLDSASDHAGTWDYVYDTGKPWRQSSTTMPALYGTRTWTPLYDSAGVVGRYRGFQLGGSIGSSSDLEQNYTYTAAGRFDTLVSKRSGNTVTRTFDYDYETNAPWVKSLSITGGHPFSVTRTYDADRPLLASIDTKWSTTSMVRYDYGHNALGQRVHAKLSGSAFSDYYSGQTYSAVTRYFGYNSRGELITETMHKGDPLATPNSADEMPARRGEYRYDSIGNRLSSGQTGSGATGDDEYLANALNQYSSRENNTVRITGTAASNATVAVEGANSTNKLHRAWGADVLPANTASAVKSSVNVYAALAGQGSGGADLIKTTAAAYFIPKALQTFIYDDDGNLTHDSVWDYTYDAENRLVAMQHRSEVIGTGMIAFADARRLEFRYDYKGRRVKKIVRKSWNGSTFATWDSETRYLYDGWNLVAEFSVATEGGTTLTLKKSYTWGLDLVGSLTASGGVGALVQIHDHSVGKTLLPAYDGNGNVVALFDATSGAVEARYEYSSFGELIRSEGSYAQECSFRFSTKFTDSESGLVYYGLRYYSPSLGRFINRDPIGEFGGSNIYSHCNGDSVNSVDYLGMRGTRGSLLDSGGGIEAGARSAETYITGASIALQWMNAVSVAREWAALFRRNEIPGGGTPPQLLNDEITTLPAFPVKGDKVTGDVVSSGGGGFSPFDFFGPPLFVGALVRHPFSGRPLRVVQADGRGGWYAEPYSVEVNVEIASAAANIGTETNWWREGASIVVGSLPLVGTAQSIVEVISGKDYITGNSTNRWLAAAGIVAGILPGGKGALKGGAKLFSHAAETTAARVVTQGHHGIPKFLGGDAQQILSKLDPKIHSELHSILRQNLREAGIPLNVGGRGGSAANWARYMNANPGAQRTAFDAVLDASRAVDVKYGTNVTQDVWRNVMNGSFTPFP